MNNATTNMCLEHHPNIDNWVVIHKKEVTAESAVDLVDDRLSEAETIQSENSNLRKNTAHLLPIDAEPHSVNEAILPMNHSASTSYTETPGPASDFHPTDPKLALTEATVVISPENDVYLKDWVIVHKKDVPPSKAELKSLVAKIQSANNALGQDKLEMSSRIDHLNVMLAISQAKIVKSEDSIEQQNTTIAALKDDFDDLQQVKMEMQRDHESNDECLKRELKSTQDQEKKYRMFIEIADKVNRELEQKHLSLVATNNELVNKVGRLEKAAGTLQETVTSVRAENAELVEKMERTIKRDIASNKAFTFDYNDGEDDDLSNHPPITPKSSKKRRSSLLRELDPHIESPYKNKLRSRTSLTPKKL